MDIALSSPLQVPDATRHPAPPRTPRRKSRSVIPGFGLTMGLTLAWTTPITGIAQLAWTLYAARRIGSTTVAYEPTCSACTAPKAATCASEARLN